MLQAGDIVTLKSGGPKMTVGKINLFNKAEVYWFSPEGWDASTTYPLEALSLASSLNVDAVTGGQPAGATPELST